MLSAKDKLELVIESFVFHVIKKEEPDPEYLDGVELTPRQNNFFKRWLSSSISNSIEYEFKSKEKEGGVYALSKLMVKGDGDFIDASKIMVSDFKRFHKGSSSDGIMVVSLVKVESGTLLYMVKMDFKGTLRYEIEVQNGKRIAVFKDVENPITEDKDAIQKVAIININSMYSWDVLAQDRQNNISYKIADFFKSFLDVREKEVSSVLTRTSLSLVKSWIKANKGSLDPQQNVTDYRGRAVDYLNSHNEFNSEGYVDSIVYDEDEERRENLRRSLRGKLEEGEIAGRLFEIKPNSIPKKDSKNIWETSTNVQIIFTGSPDSNNIHKERIDSKEIITIATSKITFK